jgi:hypothetical protein
MWVPVPGGTAREASPFVGASTRDIRCLASAPTGYGPSERAAQALGLGGNEVQVTPMPTFKLCLRPANPDLMGCRDGAAFLLPRHGVVVDPADRDPGAARQRTVFLRARSFPAERNSYGVRTHSRRASSRLLRCPGRA